MDPIKQNLKIIQGSTFRFPFYWYSDVEVVKTITGVTRGYPTVFACAAHGLPTNSSVPSSLLNIGDWIDTGLEKSDRLYVTRVDDDSFSVNVNSAEEDAYSGTDGRLVYNAPMDLSVGWEARMQIRASVDDATVIEEFTSGASDIDLDAEGLIEPVLTDAQTDALDFSTTVYDIELEETATGDVTRVAEGKVTLSKQVTRTP